MQTAATHKNSTDKESVVLIWMAPPAGTGAIRFRYHGYFCTVSCIASLRCNYNHGLTITKVLALLAWYNQETV